LTPQKNNNKIATFITKTTQATLTPQNTIPFNKTMLDSENASQTALNEGNALATGALLKRIDTAGTDILIGRVRKRSKSLQPKYYQTPDSEIRVEQHSTPRFAAQNSHKVAKLPADDVSEDWSDNHNRSIPQSFVQRLSEAVSAVVQVKEASGSYHVPDVQEADIETVRIGLDSTCPAMCTAGYHPARVGTITLYDKHGERQHTTPIATSPEYGKQTFRARRP